MRHRNSTSANSREPHDATWWLGLAALLLILTAATVASTSGPPDPGTTPSLASGGPGPTIDSNDGLRPSSGRGWWSIESASNGIIAVYHP